MIYGFSDRLKALRKERKMTQKQLALRLGVSASTVSGYECGITDPSVDTLCQLSAIFNVKTDTLLGFDGRQYICVDSLSPEHIREVRNLVEKYRRERNSNI